jgi:hypothetical protein
MMYADWQARNKRLGSALLETNAWALVIIVIYPMMAQVNRTFAGNMIDSHPIVGAGMPRNKLVVVVAAAAVARKLPKLQQTPH